MQLSNKVAVVTGGDTGIGRAICTAMAREGARVVVDYVGSERPGQALVEEIEAFGGQAVRIEADISNREQVVELIDGAVRAFGSLDIMVNNAGIEKKYPFLETPLDVYRRIVDVNLTGTWLCTQAAAKEMVRQHRGGRIINISSVHEELPMPTNAAYCASKGAIRMLMRTIAVELAEHEITVNNVCPGAVDTPMDAGLKADKTKYEQLLAEIPLRRMAKPSEIASLCLYLASDAAAYVTGASFIIDGGMTKKSGSL